MMTCSKNLLKHLKICYQNQQGNVTTRFSNFRKLMTFSPTFFIIKYSLFIFIFHICANFQTKKQRPSWHVYLNVFNHIVTF
jgi:hypothetical protein